MVLPIVLLNAFGIERSAYPIDDMKNFFGKLELSEKQIHTIRQCLSTINAPFYRFFSNYDTGIGETMEDVASLSFTEFIPKHLPKKNKKGTYINPIYTQYNQTHGKKSTNYDRLVNIEEKLSSWEIKVIRAAMKPEGGRDKLHRIPSPLEERALPFSRRHQSANASFQQTKADMFDFLLGIVIYIDRIDYYIVPSEHIKNGTLKIINQHAGAILADGSTKEGHLCVRNLDAYRVKSVFTEEELLSKDQLCNYL